MPKDLVPMLYAIFHTVYHCLYITVNNSNIYKDRSPLNLGWAYPLILHPFAIPYQNTIQTIRGYLYESGSMHLQAKLYLSSAW